MPGEKLPRPVVTDETEFKNLLDSSRFEHLWRLSTLFSASDMVPEAFKGKPANVFVVLQMALRMRVDPFMFLQGTYVVHGKPALQTTLAIALLNASGRIKGTLGYELKGDGKSRECVASAIDAATGEVVTERVTMAMAEADGWVSKPGSKWKTLPDLMLCYRSALWLIRKHYPEVIMGMHSDDEVEDFPAVTPAPRRFQVEPEPNGGKKDPLDVVVEEAAKAKAKEAPPVVPPPTKTFEPRTEAGSRAGLIHEANKLQTDPRYDAFLQERGVTGPSDLSDGDLAGMVAMLRS